MIEMTGMKKTVGHRVLCLILAAGVLFGFAGYPAFASQGPDRGSAPAPVFPAFASSSLATDGSFDGSSSGSSEDEIPMDDINEGEEPDMDGSDATSPVSLTLMDSPGAIKTGEDVTISYVLKNSEHKIAWRSSDPKIATVDQNGRVEGLTPGQVQITASVDDVERSILIKIEKPDAAAIHIIGEGISSLDVAGKIYEMETEMTRRLLIVTDPEDAQRPELIWESSDPFVGNVDANGLFTAKSVGNVIITARAGDLTDTVSFRILASGLDPKVLLRYILTGFGVFVLLILIVVLIVQRSRRKKAREEAEERARRAARRRKDAERSGQKRKEETRVHQGERPRGYPDPERETTDRMTRVFDPSVLESGRPRPPAPRPPARSPGQEQQEQPFSIDDIE